MSMDFEQYVEMNNKMLISMNEMIKKGKEEAETNAVSKATELLDHFIGELALVKNDNSLLKNELEEVKQKNLLLSERQDRMEEITFILKTDEEKKITLTKLIQKLTFASFTVNKNNIKYKLFHRSIVTYCYSKLYDYFGVKSYQSIKISDFDKALTVIYDFFRNKLNIKRCVDKRLNTYIKDINNGNLDPHEEKLVNKYLDQIKGELKNAI
ncbi:MULTISPECIES: ORF6C domain-containing protein [Paenibacillus]|uniref:ORF6C domain-containing protein n=1 Tax=Paenibacillus peoriae TaxID=59893 RepID=A0A7H0Y352_9BACL|nr:MULTISPECIES: ORF6C domain-containing protein [Paenibacillus]QNR65510.1 ORF6C domain-containing protein [Paenibacillus peoriae]